MSLTRLQEIIAQEWVNCFKGDFSSEKDLLPLRERVQVADDLFRVIPHAHYSYQDTNLFLEIWLHTKKAASLDALVSYLLRKYTLCFEGELAPTLACYHFHLIGQALANGLTTAIQEKLLSPELSGIVEQLLKEQQEKQKNKRPFAYASSSTSYELPTENKVRTITTVAYSSEVGLFFKPPIPPFSKTEVSRPPTPNPVNKSVSPVKTQVKNLDPKIELKQIAGRFARREVFSSERAFDRAKKAFALGGREPSLAEKLIRYSVWKQRNSTEAENPRLLAAKEMAEQIIKAGQELKR